MPDSQTEKVHAEEFVISEANRFRSRENITVVSGQNLVAGAVLGKITSGGKYKAYDDDASDGSQAAAGILCQAVDASGGDKDGAILIRDAEVDGDLLNWGSNDSSEITAGIADLLALGIIVR
jgi:hypothetical protein